MISLSSKLDLIHQIWLWAFFLRKKNPKFKFQVKRMKAEKENRDSMMKDLRKDAYLRLPQARCSTAYLYQQTWGIFSICLSDSVYVLSWLYIYIYTINLHLDKKPFNSFLKQSLWCMPIFMNHPISLFFSCKQTMKIYIIKH